MDMCHDIMSTTLFFLSSESHLFFVELEMRTHLLDGFIWDRKAQLLLRYGQVQPQLTPCSKARLVIY